MGRAIKERGKFKKVQKKSNNVETVKEDGEELDRAELIENIKTIFKSIRTSVSGLTIADAEDGVDVPSFGQISHVGRVGLDTKPVANSNIISDAVNDGINQMEEIFPGLFENYFTDDEENDTDDNATVVCDSVTSPVEKGDSDKGQGNVVTGSNDGIC